MPVSNKALLIALATLLFNSACTTTKPIDADEPSRYVQAIKVGDKLRLAYLDERVKEIRVTEINEREIIGKLESGGVVIADWEDIYAVERITISPLKTAGAAVGIVVAIPVLVLLAVASGCVSTYC